MITILGQKKWEALPLHVTEDIDSTYTPHLIMVATMLHHIINACLVGLINEELRLKGHCSNHANMAGELTALWFLFFSGPLGRKVSPPKF